jgi:hypothetical protein
MNKLSKNIKLKLLDYPIGKKEKKNSTDNLKNNNITLYSENESNMNSEYSSNKSDTERVLVLEKAYNNYKEITKNENKTEMNNIYNLFTTNTLINNFSISQIESFVFSQIQENQILMTNIKVYKNCFNIIKNDIKQFNYEAEIIKNNNVFIIGKIVKNTVKLKIKLYITNNHKEYKYIGKIVSNTLRSKFKVYFGNKGNYTLNLKISFALNFLGLFGMRKMKVSILDKNEDLMFLNKIPEWDIKYQKYSLNFNQRVRLTSKRNFILEDKNKKNVLQCGKIENNIYALDYESPFNPFQAFSISLTSIVNKVFCE